jgi:hypothetical protein
VRERREEKRENIEEVLLHSSLLDLQAQSCERMTACVRVPSTPTHTHTGTHLDGALACAVEVAAKLRRLDELAAHNHLLHLVPGREEVVCWK